MAKATVSDSREAFYVKLKCLYFTEGELVKALPKMATAASDSGLKAGFESHLEETKEHVKRLEEAFEILGEEPEKMECDGIKGIIKDGEWVIKDADTTPEIKDVMLAGAARYAEHYEMAGYMTAIEEAKLLDLDEIASLLSDTLSEEKAADDTLAKAVKAGTKAIIESEE